MTKALVLLPLIINTVKQAFTLAWFKQYPLAKLRMILPIIEEHLQFNTPTISKNEIDSGDSSDDCKDVASLFQA